MKDRVASSSMAGIKTATYAVDANNDGTPPLSFMYKDLKRFQDCLQEEPRIEQRVLPKSIESGKYRTKCIRFNDNALDNYENFEAAMDGLLENPSELEWLDLSFNKISTIDQVLLNYPNLKIIYLHGNAIQRLNEIEKLAGLSNLISVTLHGNPIEDIIGYKNYILTTLPQIQNLDFTTITKADRALSNFWYQKFGLRFKKIANCQVNKTTTK